MPGPPSTRHHDETDRRAVRRLACPLLWSQRDDLEALYGDMLEVWRPWSARRAGRGIDDGHHMAEAAPEELAAELLAFLRSG